MMQALIQNLRFSRTIIIINIALQHTEKTELSGQLGMWVVIHV